ncbi:unnamed protein product [Rotaria socialis]|uniref:Uncharacterized protein n=3 Tax=Rotaria socialis TaxID=392032 RepID=A0A821F0G5_9BILA|nr:unnamed protein product [Rotaria socialis]
MGNACNDPGSALQILMRNCPFFQTIKSEAESNPDFPFHFPRHQKKSKLQNFTSTARISNSLSTDEIERIVQNAFADARELVASLNINILNKIGNSITIDEVSLIVENHLEKTAKISGSSQTESSDFDSESDDEENHYQAAHDSMSSDLDSDQGIADSECFSNVSNCLFRGVRIYDNVKPSLFQSYFKVIVNGQTKFLHKQTACWLLMHDKSSLSSDRSRRVMNK